MPDSLPSAPRMLGRYELIYLMAQGGMGEVHLAKLTGAAGFEKYCIVKTILPQMNSDPQFVDRFHHEARVLVQLNHSNIAQVYDMGQVEQTLFMAIEYVAGVDVARIQSRANELGAQVPVAVALLIGQKIAEGLGYAHRKVGADGTPMGIVHRDISPQNVMVSYEGEVKVIDFGLAKSTARSKNTQPSTVMGKLGYMSPEQARAEKLDHRSDIYSCGVVIWELLAGRPLFNGQTMGEMFAAMANPQVPSLTSFRGDVSPAVDRVIARALAGSAAERYARADDFARALAEQLLHEGSIGPEELGNYARGLCPEEFAEQRRLLSRLSKVNRAPSTPGVAISQSGFEGTAIRAPISSAAQNPAALPIPLAEALPSPANVTVQPPARDRPVLLLLLVLLLFLGGGAVAIVKMSSSKPGEPPAPVVKIAVEPPAPPPAPSGNQAATMPRTRLEVPIAREIFVDRSEHFVRAGSTDGLKIGDTMKVVGPALEQGDHELIGEATVLEVWGNLARLRLDEPSEKEKGRLFGAIEPRAQKKLAPVSSKHAPHRESRSAPVVEANSGPSAGAPVSVAPAPVSAPTPAPSTAPPPAVDRRPASKTLRGQASLGGFGPLKRVTVVNEDTAAWTGCELRLPTNVHYLLNYLRAGDTESIMLRKFAQDGEERDIDNSYLLVRCNEGVAKFSFR